MSKDQEMDDREGDAQQKEKLVTLKKVCFHSGLVHERSIPQFKFHEDVTVQSGPDGYMVLASGDEPAIFHVSGIITHINVTVAGAVQHRRPGSKVDKYTVRLRIDDEKLAKSTEKGFQALKDLLKGTPKACENIAIGSGLVENRKAFKLDETPDFLLQFPRQEQVLIYLLCYPAGWNLNPLIPVTNREALQIQEEEVELPRRGAVYFEIRKRCYNFESSEGPIKQVVLIPSIIAINLNRPAPDELGVAKKAKKRRVSCH